MVGICGEVWVGCGLTKWVRCVWIWLGVRRCEGMKFHGAQFVCGERKNQTAMQQVCETQASYLHLAASKAHQSLVIGDLCSCSAKVGYTIPGQA